MLLLGVCQLLTRGSPAASPPAARVCHGDGLPAASLPACPSSPLGLPAATALLHAILPPSQSQWSSLKQVPIWVQPVAEENPGWGGGGHRSQLTGGLCEPGGGGEESKVTRREEERGRTLPLYKCNRMCVRANKKEIQAGGVAQLVVCPARRQACSHSARGSPALPA